MEDSTAKDNEKPVTAPKGGGGIVFFGSDEFSIKILDFMSVNGFTPSLIITASDKKKGRKMVLSPTLVKNWAHEHKIPVEHDYKNLASLGADLFVVASFGKIIPQEIIELPKHGTLNVHPSLLPKYRGPSPIQSAIVAGDKKTGVTIMLLNTGMDEGPIIAQEDMEITEQTMFEELREKLAELGGRLLVATIPKWIAGEIKPKDQDEKEASYTRLITKADGLINWNEKPEVIIKKMRAFNPWPGTYATFGDKRVIITSATLDEDGNLQILRVKPEGKNEMDLQTFLSNYHGFLPENIQEPKSAPESTET